MTTSAVPPTVFHGPSLDREWDSLDPLSGYNIVEVTEANAEGLGYPADARGLKVRYFRRHLADVVDLTGAAEAIAEQLRRHLVLVEDSLPGTRCWEAALADDAVRGE